MTINAVRQSSIIINNKLLYTNIEKMYEQQGVEEDIRQENWVRRGKQQKSESNSNHFSKDKASNWNTMGRP